MEKKSYTNIDAYLSELAPLQKSKLCELIQFIGSLFPDAQQKMSYNMPSFHLEEPLVYVAAYKNHIGFYPTSGPIIAFEQKLKAYKTSKGAVQFPLQEELPWELIKEMLMFRKKRMEEKQRDGKGKKR